MPITTGIQGTQHVSTGLAEDTSYTVRVRADGEQASSAWSEPVAFTTLRAASAADYFGWDPASWTPPPERVGRRAFHTDTGLFRSADLDALTVHVGDYVTTAADEQVELLDITGKLIVQHPGVKFSRCRVRDEVESFHVGAGTPPDFYYVDAIKGLGAASTGLKNLTDGHARFYACNVSGYTDALGVKKAAVSTVPRSLFRDCFLHDLNIVEDDFYTPPDASHCDYFQSNQPGGACDFHNNTIFGSCVNNYTSTQTWSRASGPNWTGGLTPYDCTFPNASTGGEEAGRINAFVMMKAGTGSECVFRNNLCAGSAYRYINATQGNVCDVIDNEVATEHLDSGNKPFGGDLRTVSGNIDWLTGAPVAA